MKPVTIESVMVVYEAEAAKLRSALALAEAQRDAAVEALKAWDVLIGMPRAKLFDELKAMTRAALRGGGQ